MQSSKVFSDISHPLENRVDPVLHRAQERVRELELELAQTKLAHVEAECRNQVRAIIDANKIKMNSIIINYTYFLFLFFF